MANTIYKNDSNVLVGKKDSNTNRSGIVFYAAVVRFRTEAELITRSRRLTCKGDTRLEALQKLLDIVERNAANLLAFGENEIDDEDNTRGNEEDGDEGDLELAARLNTRAESQEL